MNNKNEVEIPTELLPKDGRFGSGPSKVRPKAVEDLNKVSRSFLGTSHRRPGVKDVVGQIRSGLGQLLNLPNDYEIILGNGGASLIWDAAVFDLIESKSQHLSFGEFSSKFAKIVKDCPHLKDPQIIASDPGSHPQAVVADDVDLYAFTQNETSTGVCMQIQRPEATDALVTVDATSAAGGMMVDPSQFDLYYFSPQKCFGSDGGLWLGAASPRAINRIEELSSKRWVPPMLDLKMALDNSRLNQTYNTPALATLFLLNDQIQWMLKNGGLSWAAKRSQKSSNIIYDWAESQNFASPFVQDKDKRSPVVATIDFNDEISASDVSKILRANGILDTESYRKLGRNQIRIATFPTTDPEDIEALTACIDYVVSAIS